MPKIDFRLCKNNNPLSKEKYSLSLEELKERINNRGAKLYGASYAKYISNIDVLDNILNKLNIKANEALYISRLESKVFPNSNIYQNNKIDYSILEKELNNNNLKTVIANSSAFSHRFSFKTIKDQIKDKNIHLISVLGSDAGLIASGITQNPIYYSDLMIVPLEGPINSKGFLVLSNNKELLDVVEENKNTKEELESVLAQIEETASPRYSVFARKCVNNAKALGKELINQGIELVEDRIDTNIVVINSNNISILEENDYLVSSYKGGIILDTTYLSSVGKNVNDMKEYAKSISELLKWVLKLETSKLIRRPF